jgi:hypothetical protein
VAPHGFIDGQMQLALDLHFVPHHIAPTGESDGLARCTSSNGASSSITPEATSVSILIQLPMGGAALSLQNLEFAAHEINVFLEKELLLRPLQIENDLFTTPFGGPPRQEVAPVPMAPPIPENAAVFRVSRPLVRPWEQTPTMPMVPSQVDIVHAGNRLYVTLRRSKSSAGELTAGAAVATAAATAFVLLDSGHPVFIWLLIFCGSALAVILIVCVLIPAVVGRPEDTLVVTRTRWECTPVDWQPENYFLRILDRLLFGQVQRVAHVSDRLSDVQGAKVWHRPCSHPHIHCAVVQLCGYCMFCDCCDACSWCGDHIHLLGILNPQQCSRRPRATC